MLPPDDKKYLLERGIDHSVVAEANMTCVVFRGFNLPQGFNHPRADLLLRISPGYPDVPLDMWWFDPPVKRVDGQTIPATEVMEHHLGRSWQRWSRHLPAGLWRSGIDGLESFLALVRKELEKSVPGRVQ